MKDEVGGGVRMELMLGIEGGRKGRESAGSLFVSSFPREGTRLRIVSWINQRERVKSRFVCFFEKLRFSVGGTKRGALNLHHPDLRNKLFTIHTYIHTKHSHPCWNSGCRTPHVCVYCVL